MANLLDNFERFDDMLIGRVFAPISEWTFAHFGVSNYGIARYLCLLTMVCDLYDLYHQGMAEQYGNALMDLLLIPILAGAFHLARREDTYPPGTLSPFRANYLGRFVVLIGNILICLFMSSRVVTTPVMSTLILLAYYFMACDKPKGDRLAQWHRARHPT